MDCYELKSAGIVSDGGLFSVKGDGSLCKMLSKCCIKHSSLGTTTKRKKYRKNVKKGVDKGFYM